MNKEHSLLSFFLLLMMLFSSCTFTHQGSTSTKVGDIHHSPLEEMLSYLPKQWFDKHPAEPMGPTIYYLDFAAMSRDRNLPDVSGADSREAKLPLLTGLSTQGLPITTDKIDPLASSSFANWGWDVADIAQALYLPNRQISIIKGSFSEKSIADALMKKDYSSIELGEFRLFADPTESNWFAVTSRLILIAPSRNQLETVIQQRLNPISSVDEIVHLRQLISTSPSPHGLMMVASGDLAAMNERLETLPPIFGDPEASCSRTFDWDFLMVSFRSTDQYTQMEISYSFPTEQDAVANLPIVRKSLTETPSLRNPSLIWADLIDLKTVVTNGNLVTATASAASQTLLGTSISSRDFYGLLPARKFGPDCPSTMQSS